MLQQVVLTVSVALLGYVFRALLKPPPPKICGSTGGPPVTSPRVRLADGRYLAYRESGVSKDEAKHKIIITHGFNASKDHYLPFSQELVEELKLYILYYDRPGYGESDPHPKRSVESAAYDIQELADALNLGSKFYVIGVSLGAYLAWSCIKYIPERLAGVSLVVPFVHYWWSGFPSEVSREAWRKVEGPDKWTYRFARYTPWLFYWWMTQKWFPSLGILSGRPPVLNRGDRKVLEKGIRYPMERVTQQGVYESLHRDLMVGYGNWGFSPLDLKNPFPENEGSVHIWQGYEDKVIQYELNRYIFEKLPWIKYHEISDGGHLFMAEEWMCETMIRALVIG